MKKNVLQIVGSFHQGGSERQAVQLTRLLHEDKTHNIFLAALNNEGVLRREVEEIGFTDVPEFRLDSFYNFNFLKQLRRCAGYIRDNKIEIVHTHDFYTNVFGIAAARLAGVPLKIASKRETSGMRSPMQKRIERQIFNVSNHVVANSQAVKKYLIDDGIEADKINVVYNGLDTERLTPQQTDRREICRNLDLPTDETIKFITLVANLRHAVKNQPLFLRAARIVSSKFPEARFVLAGEGELKDELEDLAKHLKIADKTHFIGRCTQISDLLSVSFAGVLTSFAEGFSNSILEYMWAQLPVVATNVGGAREAIAENESGFTIELDNDEQLAARLIQLLENPEAAKKMGATGRKIVEEKFSCETQLEKTLELYRL